MTDEAADEQVQKLQPILEILLTKTQTKIKLNNMYPSFGKL
jgi:hypothetical protein